MLPVQLATIKANFTGLVAATYVLLPLRGICLWRRVSLSWRRSRWTSHWSLLVPSSQVFSRRIRTLPSWGTWPTSLMVTALQILDRPTPMIPFFLFTHVPITSVNCERVFSKLKTVLTYNRTRMTEKHIWDVLLVQWNGILINKNSEICSKSVIKKYVFCWEIRTLQNLEIMLLNLPILSE